MPTATTWAARRASRPSTSRTPSWTGSKSGSRLRRSRRKKIGIGRTVALHGFTARNTHRVRHHRAGGDERMKLAVLAAGIDSGRQIVEQGLIEMPPGEPRRQSLEIDGHDPR